MDGQDGLHSEKKQKKTYFNKNVDSELLLKLDVENAGTTDRRLFLNQAAKTDGHQGAYVRSSVGTCPMF